MRKIRRITGLGMAAACAVFMGCQETPPLGVELGDGPLELQAHKKLSPEVCSPSSGGFTTVSTNPYFPMAVGDQWSYEGEEGDEELSLLITVLNRTRLIDGVTTRVIEEREWVDDELLEISWNYFAQAEDGTICYFGEDVDIFEENDVIVHDGAWCADDPGNAPGIFMPADPQPGMKFQIELAPGIAEDEAKIVGSGPVTVEAGRFTETIRFRETTPLEKGVGFKTFAAGTGLIIDGPAELFSFTQGASTPGPPTISQQFCGS